MISEPRKVISNEEIVILIDRINAYGWSSNPLDINDKNDRAVVEKAFAHLDDTSRYILISRLFQNHTLKEISENLKVAYSIINRKYERAICDLKFSTSAHSLDSICFYISSHKIQSVLHRNGVYTMKQLRSKTNAELLSFRRCGPSMIKDIRKAIRDK